RPVRWRRLYRSDALHHLSQAEAERLHTEMGIVTLIDLRTEREIDAGSSSGLHRQEILKFPLVERLSTDDRNVSRETRDRSSIAVSAGYLAMLMTAGDKIAAALDVLSDPDATPAVFYCAAGKDRTGVFAACVLGALGVSDDAIVDDYVLTS